MTSRAIATAVPQGERLGLPWLYRLRAVSGGLQAMAAAAVFATSGGVPAVVLSGGALLTVLSAPLAARLANRYAADRILPWLLALDMMVLTAEIAVTAGHSNPFSVLYLVYVTVAAVVTSPGWTWGITGLASIAYASLSVLHQPFAPFESEGTILFPDGSHGRRGDLHDVFRPSGQIRGLPGHSLGLRPFGDGACGFNLIHSTGLPDFETVLSQEPGGYLFATGLLLAEGTVVVCANHVHHSAAGDTRRRIDRVALECAYRTGAEWSDLAEVFGGSCTGSVTVKKWLDLRPPEAPSGRASADETPFMVRRRTPLRCVLRDAGARSKVAQPLIRHAGARST